MLISAEIKITKHVRIFLWKADYNLWLSNKTGGNNLTYDEIKKNKEVCECLKKGNENLGVLGFTDHSAAHCTMVAKRAAYILS